MSIRRHSVLALLGPAAAFLCGLAAAKPAGSLPTAGSWFDASASCYVAMPRNWLVCSRGDSWNDGDFTCVVRKAGLTCRNRARRGWFLGRSSYKLF